MVMTPMTPPEVQLATSLPKATIGSVGASPHEVLLFNPDLEISFSIQGVTQVLIESPVPGSNANTFSEMRVKIDAPDRDTDIGA